MYVKLDGEVIDILRCPLCKGSLEGQWESFRCRDCATAYPRRTIRQADHDEHVFDFRIQRPPYCLPTGVARWADAQSEYERVYEKYTSLDILPLYLDEIDSVREIYTGQFFIKGRVLDVGGHQGRLRHFLNAEHVPLYVSVDPFPEVFENINSHPNLIRAYPSLLEPCNFLACHAENLPFARRSFDWVHMRSVLDHFCDPYLALKEAYRVLKDDGVLLVGLTVGGKPSAAKRDVIVPGNQRSLSLLERVGKKVRREGFKSLIASIGERSRDVLKPSGDHTFHWDYADLTDLLRRTAFVTVKEHWQEAPVSMCVYLQARKST